MKKNLLYILLLFCTCTINAQSFVEKGDSSYVKNDYNKAIIYYEDAIKNEGVSSELLYNLGNAYYRAGDVGKAMLNYERALLMSPNDSDILANINFLRSNLIDKFPDNRSFISRIWDNMISIMSANSWAWVSFTVFVITLVLIASYLLASNIMIRKIGFFGGITGVFMFIFSVVIAFSSASRASNRNFAIVTDESVVLSTSPQTPVEIIEEAALLHEGSKIEILDSVVTPDDSTCRIWYNIKVNNNEAWIKSNSVEKI